MVKPLSSYAEKRDFKKTSEPAGKKIGKKNSKRLIFVIQQHAARAMHYDLRLEIDGVLVSWAVPKGPSLNPVVKRLAVMTEDHPIEYAQFEGLIPQGQYGAGQVIIWDQGTYTPIKEKSMESALRDGQIEVNLQGKKLQGGYALVRTSLKTEEKSKWLLVKMRDKFANAQKDVTTSQPKSIKTGKKIIKAKKSNGSPVKKNEISNPEKILFAQKKIDKATFVDYYELVMPYILPRIKNRPLTMRRFPNGVNGTIFYQKDTQDYYPSYIKTQPVKRADGSLINYPLINNKQALIYMANMVAEPHVWLSRAPKLNYPDRMIFDLDPSPGVSFVLVKRAAQELKLLLDELGLTSFIMTTGSRGLHVVIPIKPDYLFDEVREIALKIAQYLVDRYPTKLTLAVAKNKRGKKIFVDTLRNNWSATGIAPYGVRAIEGAPVATPLAWKELPRIRSAQEYTIANVPARIKKIGDIWADIDKKPNNLVQAKKKLEKITGIKA